MFDSLNYDGTATAQAEGFTLAVTIEPDSDHGAPWDEECGHGPVSDWTHRDKKPGELVLCTDGNAKRYYDFAQACRIARRDGWGPPLPPAWQALIDIKGTAQEIYAEYRDAIGRRAYAAAAAMADYDNLRRWCEGQWSYVVLGVTASRNDIELGSAYLGGCYSEDTAHLIDVANELAAEAITEAQAAIVRLTIAAA